MPLLLSSANFDEVRAAIDVSLDSDMLPDDVISLGIFQLAAEHEVLRREPTAASTDPHAVRAAILLTAARLAPRIPQYVVTAFDDIRLQRAPADWSRLAAELRQQAEVELAAIDGAVSTTSTRPTFFAVASANRGR